MRQIGARQEAGKVGGIGSCGRELCCATWLTDFKSVNTNAARYQNLSINQTKLSGQCGRLKCCLNYELDTYMDALQFFPTDADVLETAKGRAFLVKKDIFKNLMWYAVSGSTQHYPLTLETVKKIKAQNREGIKPEELERAELQSKQPKEVEPEYADIVGQISLKSLEKTTRKRRDKENSRQQNEQRGPQQNQQQRGRQPQGRGQQGPRTNDERPTTNDQQPPQNQQPGNPQRQQRPDNRRGGQQQGGQQRNDQQQQGRPQQQNRNPNNQQRPQQGNRQPQNRGPRNPEQGAGPQSEG